MKKIIVYLISILLLCSTSAIAENFIAIKYGHVKYISEKESIYEGSHIYYPTDAFGFIFGKEKKNWIMRLDISKERTGSEFKNDFPLAYDGFRVNTYPITFQLGKKLSRSIPFYLLAGVGIMINDADIWQYDAYPFKAKMDNSFCVVATIGFEKKLTKTVYLFLEGRYLYSKADVQIEGCNSIKENLSNNSVWFGICKKW